MRMAVVRNGKPQVGPCRRDSFSLDSTYQSFRHDVPQADI